jgi:formylmethanofuran dehydrogenase subunit E
MTNEKPENAKDRNQMAKSDEIPNSPTFTRRNVPHFGRRPAVKMNKIVCLLCGNDVPAENSRS